MADNLVIYYSRTGTTREAAETLGARLGWPVVELRDAVSRAGWWGDLRCVWDNRLGRKVGYRYDGPPLAACDNVVVMAPVWVGHLAAPMRSFLIDQRPYAGRLAAIAVMASRGGFRAAEEVAMAMGRPPHPAMVLLQREVTNGEARGDLDAFAGMLQREASADAEGGVPRSAWLSPREA